MAWDGGNGFKVTTLREARYVNAYLRFSRNQDWVSISLPEKATDAIVECRRQVSQAIKQKGHQFMTKLFNDMRYDLIPDSSFDWIVSGGDRACFFVEQCLKKDAPYQPVSKLDGMDFIYACFDYNAMIAAVTSQAATDQNRKIVAATQQDKEQYLAGWKKQFESKPNLSWIEKMSEDQLRWAVNYLRKYSIAHPVVGDPPPENADIRALRDYLYGSFDFPNISGAELREFTRSMKGALASKKNREKGKTLNCQISEQRSKQLAELAEYHDCSKAKMIERLIKWEYQKLKSERLI